MGDQPAAGASVASVTDAHGGAVHGVYYRDELAGLGIGQRQRRLMVQTGELSVPRKDWYATSTCNARVEEAVKAGGVLACVSALSYYGFWVPPGYRDVHVRSARGKCKTSCRGYSPMTAGRTAVDTVATALECAARCMPEEDWIAVCDSVQNTMNLSAEALRGEMGALPKYVEAMFDKTDARTQSGTESVSRVRLRGCGYKVVVQPEIAAVGRADLRVGRLVIECDGRQYHSSAEEFQNDRTRDRKAAVGGWIVFRLTYDDVLFGWDDVLQDIRAITQKDRHRARAPRPKSGR